MVNTIKKSTVRAIPDDKELPQLATVLDANAMFALFHDLLFTEPSYLIDTEIDAELLPHDKLDPKSFQFHACQIERIKYKPGNNCLICYRLEYEEIKSAVLRTQCLCARVYPIGQSASRFRRAQAQPLVEPEIGPPLIHLPALGMIVWGFPNDRKLHHLPKLMDAAYLQKFLLPPIIATHHGDDLQIASLSHELIHYAPEYTCTVRVQLDLTQQPAGREKSVTLFGKLYENEQGAETDQLMHSLWQSEARSSGRLAMAQPLGYDRERRILWQQGLRGNTLHAYKFGAPIFWRLLDQAAETVALLHQSPVQCSRVATLSESIHKLEEMRYLLPQIWPPCQTMLLALIDQLLEQAESLEAQPVALLHGDLHLQNLFVADSQVALIDLDDLCQGSPCQDIGSLIAALHYRGLLAGTPLADIEHGANIFCKHYRHHAAWPIPWAEVDWFTAAALINERAFRTIARLQSGSLQFLDSLVARAMYILQR